MSNDSITKQILIDHNRQKTISTCKLILVVSHTLVCKNSSKSGKISLTAELAGRSDIKTNQEINEDQVRCKQHVVLEECPEAHKVCW